MILQVLARVRELRDAAAAARGGDYSKGYRDAVSEIENIITDLMWDAGVDDPEDD